MSTIIHEKADSLARLAQLGLTYEIVRDAILAGELARNSCTANDPPATPGILGWARTTRGLREGTIPLGWRASEAGQLSTCVDPTGAIAIAVATGDQATGDRRGEPKTKYPRGPATAAAIERNKMQLGLFDTPAPPPVEEEQSKVVTWLLLLSRTPSQVHCEVSLPGHIGSDERIESWEERIILAPVPTDPTPPSERLEEPGAEIEVEVKRRRTS